MQILDRYVSANDGQLALFTALVAVPIIMLVSLALNSNMHVRQASQLQPALDNAALAATIPGNLNHKEREALAEKVFWENFDTEKKVDLTAKSKGDIVTITGTLETNTIFADFAANNILNLTRTAKAKHTREDVICVLALNDVTSEALTFEEGAEFSAPGCSVQVNSKAPNALVTTATKTPIAKSFCVHGTYRGDLGFNAKAGCSQVEDPYRHISAPKTSGCDYAFAIAYDRVGYIKPGTYCGGLNLIQSDVEMMPGVYIMQDGPFMVGAGSKIVGEDVTIIFSGRGSTLYFYLGADVDLSASTTGPYAGLIFMQDRRSSKGAVSIIKGSNDIRLVGTMYFPTQELFISGAGTMGAESPAMAFIADKLTFTAGDQAPQNGLDFFASFVFQQEDSLMAMTSAGQSDVPRKAKTFTTLVHTDHQAAGLPPILPRSDEGAVLIQ